jgi:hypothetical protein
VRILNTESQCGSHYTPREGIKAPQQMVENFKKVEAGFCLPARAYRNNSVNIYETNATSKKRACSLDTNPAAASCLRQGLVAPPATLQIVSTLLALLLCLLCLEVLVGKVGSSTTNEHNGVHTDAEAGGVAR